MSLARLHAGCALAALFAAPFAAAAPAGGSCSPFLDLGQGLAGASGVPVLAGDGPLYAGTPLALALTNARPNALAALVIGSNQANLPFRGGTMVPSPDQLVVATTNGSGALALGGTVPASAPAGTSFYLQCWIDDPAGPAGLAASNALMGTTLGTLFDEMSQAFDARIQNAGPAATALPIYSTQDFANRVFVRNPSCWAAGLDLSGISPWNQAFAQFRAGTLVSPRHLIFAKHFPLSTTPGSNEIVFVTPQDVTVTRQVVGVAYPGGDMGVAVLDADVPPEITYYKILPGDWRTWLKQTEDLPMLHLDQEEKALVRDMRNITIGSANVRHKKPADPTRILYWEDLIGGDSGNAAFVLVGDEPVVVLTHYSAILGPFYTELRTQVNQAMANLGGGYQLTEIDLSECVDW